MAGEKANLHKEWDVLSGVESRIAVCLDESADELAHAECFDLEQRAEIYAILEAIRTDSRNHRAMVELLASKLCEGSAHA
jgi:hypothetical protein